MSEWIKTSEKLPEWEDADESGKVWVWSPHEPDAFLVYFGYVGTNDITHWMPKPKATPPEPPQAETEEKWTWMMDYCKQHGLAPANGWEKAQQAWEERNAR